MSDWKVYKLGEIADITSSKRIFLSDYVEVGIPFYRSKEIIEKANGEGISTKLYIDNKKYFDIKLKFGSPIDGDVLMAAVGERAGVPYCVLNDGEFYFKDGNLIWFRNFIKEINSKFLYYYFRSSIGKNALESKMIGSAQKALTIIGLKNLSLLFPSRPTQKAIAEILSSLDDKIELNNAINKNLEDLTQALFKQWFVDFEFPNEIGEPYKSSGGEMVESELGEIPRGWNLTKIKDLNPVLETGRRPVGGVKGIEEGVPSIGAESIKGIGYFDYSKTKYVSNEYAQLMNRGIIKGFELLIYKDGGKPGTFIPHFSMFGNGFPFDKMVINEHVFLLNFNNNLKFNVFCYFFFNTPYVISMLENSGGKAAIPGINQSDINNLLVFQPENDLVQLFGEIAFGDVSTILQNCKENYLLSKLRDTLIPKLISGELEVNEALLQTDKAMQCLQ